MPSQRPGDSPLDRDSELDFGPDFERSLQELEQSLQVLKARYGQVQLDQQHQQDLQQKLRQTERELKHELKHNARGSRAKTLKAELKQLNQQLEELEVALESQLFSWGGLREVFWQAVRFGGLGIVIGWVLKSLAG